MDREKVIKGLECHQIDNNHRINCADCPYYVDDDNHIRCANDLHDDAIALLKEQADGKKRVMKVIWDTLHEGLSIDTIPDQDWVYELIRHRIEDT